MRALAARSCGAAGCSTPGTAAARSAASVSSWTPRTPRQALVAWKAYAEAERQEVSEWIDALYKHRKQTLRFWRRCEDADDLCVLQQTLDPQPRRNGGIGRSTSVLRGCSPAVASSCPASPVCRLRCPSPAPSGETPASLGGVAAPGGLRLPGGARGCGELPLSHAAAAAVAAAAAAHGGASPRYGSCGDEVSRAARLAVAGLARVPRLRPELDDPKEPVAVASLAFGMRPPAAAAASSALVRPTAAASWPLPVPAPPATPAPARSARRRR